QMTLQRLGSNSMVPVRRPNSWRVTRLINIAWFYLPAAQSIQTEAAGQADQALLVMVTLGGLQQVEHSLVKSPLHVLVRVGGFFQVIIIGLQARLINDQVKALLGLPLGINAE